MSDPKRRIQRILTLIPFLRKNPGTPLETLGRLTGSPAEELVGDLNRMLLCGVPPYMPHDYIGVDIEGERVSLRFADHFKRPIRFTLKEALALKLALESLPAGGDAAYREARRTLLAKMDGILGKEAGPARVAGRLETVRGRETATLTARGRERVERVLAAVARGIAERHPLEIEYYSASSDALRARRIQPYGVVDQDGETYLVALDGLRKRVLPFRVDRVRAARVLEDERFTVPARFTLDAYRKREMKFPKRPAQTVKVRFAREVARWVREDRDYRGEPVEETPEGDLIVTHKAGSLPFLVNRLLQYGKNAEVLSPPEVRAEMRRTLDRALEAVAGPKGA